MDGGGGGGVGGGPRIRGKGIAWVDMPVDEGEEIEEEGDGEEGAGPRPTDPVWRKLFMRKRKVEHMKSADGAITYRCSTHDCPHVLRHKHDKVTGIWVLQVRASAPSPIISSLSLRCTDDARCAGT